MTFNHNGTVIADPVTLQTAQPDVFVGGDALTGPSSPLTPSPPGARPPSRCTATCTPDRASPSHATAASS